MRGRELLEVMEYIDDELVEEAADIAMLQKKKRKNTVKWYRISSVAACILLIGTISILAFQQNRKYEAATESAIAFDTAEDDTAETMEETTVTTSQADMAIPEEAEASYTIIEDFPPKEMANTESSSNSCYKAPEKGGKITGIKLKHAIEYYEKTDGIYSYHIVIDVFGERPDNNGDGTDVYNELRTSEAGYEMLTAEYERLLGLGYKVELSEEYSLTGYLTAKEIESFEGLAEYGYMLLFLNE